MKRLASKIFIAIFSFLFILPLFSNAKIVKAAADPVVLIQIVIERGKKLTESDIDTFIAADINRNGTDGYVSKFSAMSSSERNTYKSNNKNLYSTRVWNYDENIFIPDSENTLGHIKFDTVTIVSQNYYSDETDFSTHAKSKRFNLETYLEAPDSFCKIDEMKEKYCGPKDRNKDVDHTVLGIVSNKLEYLNKNIAYAKMTYSGDVTISIANGVDLEAFQLFYIIPITTEGGTQLFCSDSAGFICPRAKSLESGNTNWRDNGRVGTMNYSGSTINNAFEKSDSSTGGKIYSGFNVFNAMNSTYASLAKPGGRGAADLGGAYVTSLFSIKYAPNGSAEKKTYTANKRIREFDFEEVGNVGSSSAATNESFIYTVNDASVSQVYKIAALIAQPNTEENSKLRSNFMEIFNKYVKPIAYAVIGVMFVVTGTMTVITIVKSSDEPEVRSAAIKRLIVLVTGAVVVFLIILLFEPIVTVVSGWF